MCVCGGGCAWAFKPLTALDLLGVPAKQQVRGVVYWWTSLNETQKSKGVSRDKERFPIVPQIQLLVGTISALPKARARSTFPPWPKPTIFGAGNELFFFSAPCGPLVREFTAPAPYFLFSFRPAKLAGRFFRTSELVRANNRWRPPRISIPAQ